MQVSVDESTGLERRLTVVVPEERVADQITSRLQQLSQTTRVDGFRPGKVPRSLIEKRYGAQVREQVVAETLQATLGEALQQESLRPAHEPQVVSLDDSQNEGFSFSVRFEVYPEVDLATLASVEVEQQSCEIDDAAIDWMVSRLRERNLRWQAVERAAADGDTLLIDFVGKLDGEAFEGGTAQDFELKLGSGSMIDGFESGLLGASAGETRTLDIQFPEEYGAENLAGKPASFEVTVKEVRESSLPELDDEFFAIFDIKEGGVDAFREAVKNNMERERHEAISRNLKTTLVDAVSTSVSVDLPKALVQVEAHRLFDQTKREMVSRGIPPEAIEAAQVSDFEDRAAMRVKLGLIIGEVIRTESLQATPEQLRQRVEMLATGYEDPQAVVRWYYEDKSRLQELESLILEDEALAWILRQAKVTTVPISFDELMNTGEAESA